MQLQEDRRNGFINDQQYRAALNCFNWAVAAKKQAVQSKGQSAAVVTETKPQKRKRNQMNTEERNIRNAIRSITKWLFDVEIFREDETPLFQGNEISSRLKFLEIANRLIDYMCTNPVISAQKGRGVIIDKIEAMVSD